MGTKFNFLKFDEEKGYETSETPPDGYGQATIMLRPNFIEDSEVSFESEIDYGLIQGNKVTFKGKKYVVMDKEFLADESTLIYTVGPMRGEYREPTENEISEYKNYFRKRQIEAQMRQNSPIALPGVSANLAQQGKGNIVGLR